MINKLRSYLILFTLMCGILVGSTAFAQDEGAGAAADNAAQTTNTITSDVTPTTVSFLDVVFGGGALGVALWIAIFLLFFAFVYLIVDAVITIRRGRIMPEELVSRVQAAMEQGDVMKALQACQENPSPLANILSAGFSNVEEGFDAIQEAVSVSAEMESERLMQRVNYLNVVGNLAPMLGLLGTVAGMIYAFANLAGGGAAAKNLLPMNISQALYTTAAGLIIAIPALACFYFFRNLASTVILQMEMLTMEEIKILRNVEVVDA